MGRCLFTNCKSDTKSRGIAFFRVPFSQSPNVAKLWVSNALRADSTFRRLPVCAVVCIRHFHESQLYSEQFGTTTRLRVKTGEVPFPNGVVPYSKTASSNRKTSPICQTPDFDAICQPHVYYGDHNYSHNSSCYDAPPSPDLSWSPIKYCRSSSDHSYAETITEEYAPLADNDDNDVEDDYGDTDKPIFHSTSVMEGLGETSLPITDGLSDSLYPTDIKVKVEPGDSSVNMDSDQGVTEVKTEPGSDGADNLYPTDIEVYAGPESPSVNAHSDGGEYRELRSFQRQQNWTPSVKTKVKVPIAKTPFQCKMCSHSFTQRSHLTSHMRTHTQEKSFQCTICGKSFAQRSNLTVHMRTHTGEKPFQCETCSSSFTCRSNLTMHMRTHTKEKPFHCKICSSKFAYQVNLLDHMRTHPGEKPYQCEICSHSFTWRGNLSRHMRIHTEGKPFQCEICCSSYTQQYNLTRHMKIHSGEKPFQRKVCTSSFSF